MILQCILLNLFPSVYLPGHFISIFRLFLGSTKIYFPNHTIFDNKNQILHEIVSILFGAAYEPFLSAFLNSFLDSGDFCRLLATFANSLDLDQA